MSTKKRSTRIAASQSFNSEEIELLDFTYATLLRGDNPAPTVTRSKVFAKLLRKIKAMKARTQAMKDARVLTLSVASESIDAQAAED